MSFSRILPNKDQIPVRFIKHIFKVGWLIYLNSDEFEFVGSDTFVDSDYFFMILAAPKVSRQNPKTDRLSWDDVFMHLALLISKRGSCKFHETGVVFVDPNHRIVSLGYNGPTEGDYHCTEVGCAKVDGHPQTKKLERCRGAHAEINGIINAQDTRRLRGATLYSVLFPCYDCMKALNNVGVKEIVYYQSYERIQTGGEKFEEEDESLKLAEKRGIKIRKYVNDETPEKDASISMGCAACN